MERVSCADSKADTDLSREAIKEGPEYRIPRYHKGL